jgi:guanine deaminase
MPSSAEPPATSPSAKSQLKAIRGSFLDFVDDPFYVSPEASVRYLADGLLVLEGGKIRAFGAYADLQAKYGEISTTVYADRLIMPGFIDTHIHYPQTEIIAAYGEQLLTWLDQYVFPTEEKFKDKDYARAVADFFLDQLLSNGTTTALVFAAVFPQSVEAFFEAAERRHLCMIAGKVMMDRNAPAALCDTAESAYQETRPVVK